MRSEKCSLHLTHPSAHTWSSGQPTVQRREQSWTSCQSRDSNPQPWVTSGFKSNTLELDNTRQNTPQNIFLDFYYSDVLLYPLGHKQMRVR